MSNEVLSEQNKKIHFVGAGGVSMSGLMKWCISFGFEVSGSDRERSAETDVLVDLGAKIFIGHSAKNLGDADIVVYTSAVADDNAELVAARTRGLPVIKRSELLGEILTLYPRSVGVAGSHGKTTTTAMLWEILETAGETPAVFLGGEYGERGNFCAGGATKRFAVAEACEYKSNFLDLKPYIRVILNVDDDHLESFGGKAAEIAAFKEFASGGISIVNADDEGATLAAVENSATFGIENFATFTAKRVRRKEGAAGYSFTAYEYGKRLGRITLKVSGRHAVYDALAALAAARLCGVTFSAIKTALSVFSGVKRRNEAIGEIYGLKTYADYAHHPTELKAFLAAKRELGISPIVVFQPHTYSRTRILKKEFIEALACEKRLIIYKTYPAREQYEKDGDAKTLYEEIFALNEERQAPIRSFRKGEQPSAKSACECQKCYAPLYAESEEELIKAIGVRTGGAGETGGLGAAGEILFIGAGDIYDIGKRLCEKFSQKFFENELKTVANGEIKE